MCRYDRAGIGSSPPGPRPRTIQRLADDERNALAAAGAHPPYVLVGASFGGLITQYVAHMHPKDVAGLVLVDSLAPGFDAAFARVMGRAAADARNRSIAQNAEGIRPADQVAAENAIRALPASLPLAVLRHSDSFDPGGTPSPRLERLWTKVQRQMAGANPVETVPHSTHRIHEDNPDAVVAAILRVLAEASGYAG